MVRGVSRASYVIPVRVRNGALRVLSRWGVPERELVKRLEQTVGFATQEELSEALGDRFGPDARAEFDKRYADVLFEAPLTRWMSEVGQPLSVNNPHEALLAVPDALFNGALEHGRERASGRAFELGRDAEAAEEVTRAIDELYAANGVPFRFDEEGRLVRAGSVTLGELRSGPRSMFSTISASARRASISPRPADGFPSTTRTRR